MVHRWMLRLNKHDGYSDSFDESFKRFQKVIGVYHTGSNTKENPHYHFVIDSDIALRDTIRKHFKKYYDKGSGNGHMSIKPCDASEKVFSYLFHEDDKDDFEIVYNDGYNIEEINKFKEMNIQIKQEIKNNTVDVNIQQILDKIRRDNSVYDYKENDWVYSGNIISGDDVKHFENKRKIFRYIMEHYMDKGGWLPNRFQCERMMMKIQILLCTSDTNKRQFINCQFNEWFSDKHLKTLIY